MAEPKKVYTSSNPDEAGGKSQMYKSLLNQQVQKLWKQLPVYQTVNEGSEHLPKFRTTVWVNGVTYTSPNTFQQRKMAEMDGSKFTYLAMMHKLRQEAVQHVHEHKYFCKSILFEYAARMKIQQPTYNTVQLDSPIPIFRSSLVFNGESWVGDDSRNKKEAENSAAAVAILKYLDSESGKIMSEIITVKFKHYAELKNLQNADSGTNMVVQIGSDNGLTLNEAKGEEGTETANISAPPEPCVVQNATIPVTHLPLDVNQTHSPQAPITAPTPVVPVPSVLAQTPFAGTNPEPCVVQNATIPVTHQPLDVNQTHSPQASIAAAPTPVVPVPTVLAQTPFAGTNPEPCLVQNATIPVTHQPLDVNKTHLPQAPIAAPTPVVPVPTVLAQTPFASTNVAPTDTSANVVHPESSEASFVVAAPPPPTSSPALAQDTSVSLNSSKKRNRKNKKNAKKKMRVDNPLPFPAMALSQVPTFTAQ